MKRHWLRTGLGLLVVGFFLLHAAGMLSSSLIERLDALSYDARLRLLMPKTPFDGIVIVDIDEKTLAHEGRMLMNRQRMADLVTALTRRYHAAAVGFDVVFAEPDRSSGMDTLDQLAHGPLRSDPAFQTALNRLRPQLNHDAALAASLKGQPVVLGYYFTHQAGGQTARQTGALPPPLFAPGVLPAALPLVKASGYGANLPVLAAAATAGHFNPAVDVDGIVRRVPMLIDYQGAAYESLSLAVVRAVLGWPPVTPVIRQAGGRPMLEALRVGDLTLPVDPSARVLVPYRGNRGSFRYYSAVDILDGRIPTAALEGKIVLVGTTAPGLMDLRATPVNAVYPGVEIHANVISGMLEQHLLYTPGWAQGAMVVLLLLAGLVLALALPRLSPARATLFTAIVLAVLLSINLFAWAHAGLVLPLAGALFMTLALYGINMVYGFFIEARAKRQIAGLFGQYVPPELVDRMSRNPLRFDMKSESRDMTVLFCDVRHFTRIAEQLDPEQLSLLMNAYLSPMTEVIHRHHGTIDKYIGDAIMAFWGAPLEDADHARHAVATALEMQELMHTLNADFVARGWPALEIGIGLCTGVMHVGNMGSRFRRAYTVMGDAVNLASRLESLTREYGVGIICADATREAVPAWPWREVDRVRVKGKDTPVAIHEPLPPQVAGAMAEELERFAAGLQAYRQQRWPLARQHFAALHAAHPEHRLYDLYLGRIEQFEQTPPDPDWEGIFAFQSK